MQRLALIAFALGGLGCVGCAPAGGGGLASTPVVSDWVTNDLEIQLAGGCGDPKVLADSLLRELEFTTAVHGDSVITESRLGLPRRGIVRSGLDALAALNTPPVTARDWVTVSLAIQVPQRPRSESHKYTVGYRLKGSIQGREYVSDSKRGARRIFAVGNRNNRAMAGHVDPDIYTAYQGDMDLLFMGLIQGCGLPTS